MTPEEFEKYFEKLEIIFGTADYLVSPTLTRNQQEVKQILEEIWQDGYDKGLEKGTDMFLVELDR